MTELHTNSPDETHQDASDGFEGAAETTTDGVSRRSFLTTVGATTAAAAASAGLTGCLRKPKETILPFANRPEDLIPGRPTFYASAFQLGATVQGVVVENQDGRPTKMEGNPLHPMSGGAATVWAQASILDLYDPDRSKSPLAANAATTWDAAWASFDAIVGAKRASAGAGLALVIPAVASPTFSAALTALKKTLPKAQVVLNDLVAPTESWAGVAALAGTNSYVSYAFENADVVAAFDSDFLVVDGDALANARGFMARRKVDAATPTSNRLYVAETSYSMTGATADHRVRLRASDIGPLLAAIAAGVGVPGAETGPVPEHVATFVAALIADLKSARGTSAVIVGARQPAAFHALGLAINAALGNVGAGKPVQVRVDPNRPATIGLAALASALGTSVDTVVALGTNPAYSAPGSLKLAEGLKKVTLVHVGIKADETAAIANLHIPASHPLEAWGDLRAFDGTVSIVQPLIAPLFDTPSLLEVVARMGGSKESGANLVRATWAAKGGSDDANWREWLHTGVIKTAAEGAAPAINASGLAAALATAPAAVSGGIEVNIHLCQKVLDGRFSNNAWLQEVPDTMSKVTWDNVALMARATATGLGLANGDLVTITVNGASVTAPSWVLPGQCPDTVSIALGYGRTAAGRVAEGAGFDAYPLLGAGAWFAGGATVTKAGGNRPIASTQMYARPNEGNSWNDRQILLEGTLKTIVAEKRTKADDDDSFPRNLPSYQEDRDFVENIMGGEKNPVMPASKLKSLWTEPELTGTHQWGMVIDLNACTGCNACTVACQAENNISVVGRDEVMNGREMHWIRIDRYFKGDRDEPYAAVQPMACHHCENAPCENVCPVQATAHSPEGLNDMAYNRCIGTRYCANNCPYKVRRFNFYNYNLDIDPMLQMVKNPDVTVRFRGVIEKCSYCVQRITEARIDAKVNGDGIIPDGAVVTACQQTCPTGAIIFGDIANPDSRVSAWKKSSRNYTVLGELNNTPRTTYLARIRNLNPELV